MGEKRKERGGKRKMERERNWGMDGRETMKGEKKCKKEGVKCKKIRERETTKGGRKYRKRKGERPRREGGNVGGRERYVRTEKKYVEGIKEGGRIL